MSKRRRKITVPDSPANAVAHPNIPYIDWHMGLTKREYFAAMAMQGLLSGDVNAEIERGNLVRASVIIADDLIEELNILREE